MIVLDEQLKNAGIKEQLSEWYQGAIVTITSLRPGSVIKDDGIPMLLRQVSEPIFVTINTTDFWQQVDADNRFCVICFPLTDDRVREISGLLRRLFQLKEFKTRQLRCGKVALVSHASVQYYEVPTSKVQRLTW